jgi:hypothetical protein
MPVKVCGISFKFLDFRPCGRQFVQDLFKPRAALALSFESIPLVVLGSCQSDQRFQPLGSAVEHSGSAQCALVVRQNIKLRPLVRELQEFAQEILGLIVTPGRISEHHVVVAAENTGNDTVRSNFGKPFRHVGFGDPQKVRAGGDDMRNSVS